MSPDAVVLIGNPRPGSRTRALGLHVAAELGRPDAVVLELADLTAVTYTAEPAAAPAPDESALDRVRSASLLVVATPSYKGTYTGLLKLFLDRVPHQGLAGVVAVPVAVAGSEAHAAATAGDLARLLRELGADVPAEVAVLESQLPQPDVAGAAAAVATALADARLPA
jgi:FMN reductase